MNKGIVMEITNKYYIVMTRDGEFKRFPNRGSRLDLGAEISLPDKILQRRTRIPSITKMSAFTAAILVCVIVFTIFSGSFHQPAVAAYVSMDINPSVEIGINEEQQVVELTGLNTDGKKLVSSIQYKKKKLQDVVHELLSEADTQYLNQHSADIIISSSVVHPNSALSKSDIDQRVKQQVVQYISKKYPATTSNYHVDAINVPSSIRQEANKLGLSAGKYALYLDANAQGTKIPVVDFQKNSVELLSKKYASLHQDILDSQQRNGTDWLKLLNNDKTGKYGRKPDLPKKTNEHQKKKLKPEHVKQNPAKPKQTKTQNKSRPLQSKKQVNQKNQMKQHSITTTNKQQGKRRGWTLGKWLGNLRSNLNKHSRRGKDNQGHLKVQTGQKAKSNVQEGRQDKPKQKDNQEQKNHQAKQEKKQNKKPQQNNNQSKGHGTWFNSSGNFPNGESNQDKSKDHGKAGSAHSNGSQNKGESQSGTAHPPKSDHSQTDASKASNSSSRDQQLFPWLFHGMPARSKQDRSNPHASQSETPSTNQSTDGNGKDEHSSPQKPHTKPSDGKKKQPDHSGDRSKQQNEKDVPSKQNEHQSYNDGDSSASHSSSSAKNFRDGSSDSVQTEDDSQRRNDSNSYFMYGGWQW